MALADRTVWAKVADRKLVFSDDQAAKSVTTFEVVRTHEGGEPAAGKRFEIVSPRGVLGDAPRAVLMLALEKDKPGKMTLLDAYPDADGKLFDYLSAAAKVPKFDFGRRIAYFAEFLENEHPDISEDARRRFADVPNKALREHRGKLPAARLRDWLASEKISAMNKGLYGLMLGIAGKPEDETVLRAALKSVQGNVVGAGGVLVGLCLLTGKADEVIGAALRDRSPPAAVREGAVGAVRYLWDEEADPKHRDGLRALFRLGLADKDAAPAVISELAMVGEFSLTQEIQAYWLDPARRSAKSRTAVFRYRDSLGKDEREAFRKFLAANPDQ